MVKKEVKSRDVGVRYYFHFLKLWAYCLANGYLNLSLDKGAMDQPTGTFVGTNDLKLANTV